MKNILQSILIITTILSCSDSKKQELLKQHIQKQELQDFQSQLQDKPELDIYLRLLTAKTKTTITTVGYESVFEENTDSIIDFFLLELKQDSIDLNHKDLPKADILQKIAIDIKPLVESYNLFKGISITLTTKNHLTENVGTYIDISYKQLFTNIPDASLFKYQFFDDTLSFEDCYYNGKKAYKGKMYNKMQFGYWEYWYPSGMKEREGEFVGDKKLGVWRYWYSNGTKKKEGQFVGDKKVGDWRYWDETGNEQK